MAKRKHHFWRKVRVGFRCLRILFLSLVLLILFLLVGFNIWGLPRFITSMIRDELRQQHFNIEFGRIRLSGFHHLIAENLRLSSVSSTNMPTVQIPRAEIILDTDALCHLQLQLRRLYIQKARMDLPAASKQAPDRILSITNIQTQLEFLPNDVWHLTDLQAEIRGAKTIASAYLTNVSRFGFSAQPGPKKEPNQWQRELIDMLDLIEHVQFQTERFISLDISGDAARPASFWVN